jgi:hypothetical protein
MTAARLSLKSTRAGAYVPLAGAEALFRWVDGMHAV